MTPEQRHIVTLYSKFEDANNIDFSDFLSAMAAWMDTQAKEQTHDGVKSCLIGCAEALRHASFTFYASTK